MRILLNLPDPPDSKLFLNEKIKEELMEENFKKMDKLEVYDVGDAVTDVKKGDLVYVPINDLRTASLVEIDGARKGMINSLSVAIIW